MQEFCTEKSYIKINYRRHKWTFLEALIVAMSAENAVAMEWIAALLSSCFCCYKTAVDVEEWKAERSALIAELSCSWFCSQTLVAVATTAANNSPTFENLCQIDRGFLIFCAIFNQKHVKKYENFKNMIYFFLCLL